ncbi:MAG: lysozyme [Patescibacteria group bacterium]|nr:lysozyme [Patescibacteria group bacterium]
MRCNDAGLALIKRFEGCRLTAYPDAGGYSIGWGHHAPNIAQGMTWTQQEADAQLVADISEVESEMAHMIGADLSDNQWSALVDLFYNVGAGKLKGTRTLALLNEGKFNAVADRLLLWNLVMGSPNMVLEARRKAERELFLTPDAGNGAQLVVA